MLNFLGMDRAAFQGLFQELGEKPFRASQILQWIHQKRVTDIDSMTNLSKAIREQLSRIGRIEVPEVVSEQISKDGTRKWLFEMEGGNQVETVFIPESGRGTLCVSSQIGCALNCSFCSTAQQGFNGNLSTAEIIAQVWVAQGMLGDTDKLTNVVMMGMGEPLLNFDNVVASLDLMMDDNAYGLSKRRVTLSTSGVVPALDDLSRIIDVSLAVSLHATDDALRDQLVPINKKYPIPELLAACKRYTSRLQHRKVTFEYVMLEGINDSPGNARALCRLLSNVPSKVNLIPFNPFPNTCFRCSSAESIERFSEILRKAGLVVTTRKTRGEDIDAACGQLVGRVNDRTRRQHKLMAVNS